MAGAAILHQEGQKLAHAVITGGVDQTSALAPLCDQAGAFQFLQMKRECRRRGPQPFGDGAGAFPKRSGTDQTAENRKARFLRQRGQPGEGLFRFHISKIVEILRKSRVEADFIASPAREVMGHNHFRASGVAVGSAARKSDSSGAAKGAESR